MTEHQPPILLPKGFAVGHWADTEAITGCTVVVCPPNTVGGCEVRGSSPGSREIALLGSEKTMQEVHAVLLTGGSAFGLAAADGVMRYLEERNIGYQTPWARVPIVPAAVIFDLNIGSSIVRPGPRAGYDACMSAAAEIPLQGNVGAGIGATVGKWGGPDGRMKGGFGAASRVVDGVRVSAIAVVNAVGDVIDENNNIIAGARSGNRWLAETSPYGLMMKRGTPPLANTTLIGLMTDAHMTKVEANRVAQRAHDGMARAIKPIHTSYDGDTVFVLASGGRPTSFDVVAEMGADLTAEAIRSAVAYAASLAGVPAREKV